MQSQTLVVSNGINFIQLLLNCIKLRPVVDIEFSPLWTSERSSVKILKGFRNLRGLDLQESHKPGTSVCRGQGIQAMPVSHVRNVDNVVLCCAIVCPIASSEISGVFSHKHKLLELASQACDSGNCRSNFTERTTTGRTTDTAGAAAASWVLTAWSSAWTNNSLLSKVQPAGPALQPDPSGGRPRRGRWP